MSRSATRSSGSNSSPIYVHPVAVSEKSTLESVVDFFADVVPHSTSSPAVSEQIIWVRFEQLSLPGAVFDRPDDKKDITLVILGYANGAQIWQIHPSGEAQELLSLRQGPVKVYSVLHKTVESESSSPTSQCLIASADESKHSSAPFSNLKLTLLFTGEKVWNHSFKTTINDVHSNSKLLLVTFHQKIAAFDLTSLKPAFTLSGCLPGTDWNMNPVALGPSWLAYADVKLVTHVKSQSEENTNTALSYTASVLSTAKNVAQGVTNLGESLLSTFAMPYPSRRDSSAAAPGVVTVVDCDRLNGEGTADHFELTDNYLGDAVICHFQALPAHSRLAYLKFDYSGTLLFCACSEGQNFHIYRLLADTCGSKQAGLQHLYILHRGDTSARVLDVTYCLDSRWVAVCTARGTTHVFPINPYGGKCTARTHTNQYVVNKSTKYEKSAGLDEFTPSPADSSSSTTFTDSFHPSLVKFNSGALENPRIKSYTDTTISSSLVRIKQSVSSAQSTMHKHIPSKNIAALFVPTHGRTRKHSHSVRSPQARESLYIIGNGGNLLEYILEPYCECEQDKINDTTELKLSTTARSRWNLNRTFTHKDRNKLSPNQLLLGSSPGSDTPNMRYGSKESISSDTGLSKSNEFDKTWLSQVEIVTYSGPNRRLWMGPQFKFKTYNSNSIAVSSQSPALFPSSSPEIQATSDIICDATDLESLQINNHPTPPITMPLGNKHRRVSGESRRQRTGSLIDEIFIEAGSFEPSPYFATTEMSFDAFEDAVENPSSYANTSDLLADAIQDQQASSEGLSSRDLMVFPPGS